MNTEGTMKITLTTQHPFKPNGALPFGSRNIDRFATVDGHAFHIKFSYGAWEVTEMNTGELVGWFCPTLKDARNEIAKFVQEVK